MRSALVTGVTGLLGSWLVKWLVSEYDRVIAVVRSDGRQSAGDRVRGALSASEQDESRVNAIMSRVTVYEGDIQKDNLGLAQQYLVELFNDHVCDVFHSAARAEFEVPYEQIYAPNVSGTRNVIKLCWRLKHSSAEGGRVTLHHISTVAVAGDYEGSFTEADFECGQAFHNTYERTKFESEQLVRSHSKDMRVVIYRPGILTGDSLRGLTTNFKMLYQPIHFFAYGLFHALPANPNSMYSFVPVDAVAEAIALLSRESGCRSGQVYQLVSNDQVSLREFIDSICEFFGCRPPRLEATKTFPRERLSELQWRLAGPFIPYFNYRVTFEAKATNGVLSRLGFCWPRVDRAFLYTLYRYCRECGFVRKPTIACL